MHSMIQLAIVILILVDHLRDGREPKPRNIDWQLKVSLDKRFPSTPSSPVVHNVILRNNKTSRPSHAIFPPAVTVAQVDSASTTHDS
jgi:hypothetical protein